MEVGGWVQVSLGDCFFLGKSSQNSPKPVLIFWSSIPCALLKVVGYYDLSVPSMSVMGFQKKGLDGGGWVGGVSSIQVFLGFFEFFKLCKAPKSLHFTKSS